MNKMMRRALLMAICLSIVRLGGFPTSQPPPEEPRLITVCPEGPPICQFSTIGGAVEAASPYDLIQIYPGTYKETLTISKSLRLVATEPEQVLLQGARTGEPTLTIQVQDRLDMIIEGLRLLAPPGPYTCRDRDAGVCSDGIDIRGEGALGLTLVNVQITQLGNQGATGIHCSQFFRGTAQVVLRRSRIVASHIGLLWDCNTPGSIDVQNTIFSGNNFVGAFFSVYIGSSGDTPLEISIKDSLFTANYGTGLGLLGDGFNAVVEGSEFLNNGIGVAADLRGDNLLEISKSLFVMNGYGVIFGGIMSAGSAEGVRLLLKETKVLRNVEEGVRVWSAGEVEMRNNLIEGNGHGVRVIQASGGLALYENKVIGNEGWGVALDQPECFPKPLAILFGKKVFRIRGEDNEIRDNKKGDLCPEDFNWPEGFVKP